MKSLIHQFFALPFGCQLTIVFGSLLLAAILTADAIDRMKRRRRVDASIERGWAAMRADDKRRAAIRKSLDIYRVKPLGRDHFTRKPALTPDESAMLGHGGATGPRGRKQ